MPISFACGCGKPLRARDELAGKKTRCPQCGEVLTIPQPEPEVEPEGGIYGLQDPDPSPSDDDETPLRPVRPSTYHRTVESSREAERPKAPTAWSASSKSRDDPGSSLMEYAYVLLAFALIPLVASLLGSDDKREIHERIEQTLQNATPEEQTRALQAIAKAEANGRVSREELLAAMPGGRLAGAHLAHDSTTHWVYAGIATAAFLLLISLFFSVERVNPIVLFLIGLFTGTVGIIFLLAVQFCSRNFGFHFRGRGWFVIVMLVLAFIGWSYSSALDADSNFFLSAIGFTFGVGLCEEFTKAIPLFFYFKRYSEMGWRGACLWGLASGAGFGVSEGVMYASDHYNGISGPGIYVVRFISCVALHAMWSASVGIAVAKNVDEYERVGDAGEFGLFMLRIIGVPMALHGFYDTLLKKEMNGWALGVALLTFGWMAYQIEVARGLHPTAGRPKRKLAY